MTAYYPGRKRIVAGAPISVHDYVKKILTARVYDVAIESPLDPMPRLSKRIGVKKAKVAVARKIAVLLHCIVSGA